MATETFAKIIEIIKRNPGLDAIALKGKGWRPSSHGSLRNAALTGVIYYDQKKGGWFVVDTH